MTRLLLLPILVLLLFQTPARTESRFERSAREKAEKARQVVWLSHEPLMFSQRKGGMAEDWPARYELQHTEENISRMAALGARYGRLHFYKGFGLAAEMPEIHNSMRAAKYMHDNGMKVSLYVGGTMFIETFYRETPEALEWEQRDQYGRPVPYMVDAQTFRHFACPNEPAYRKYIERVLDVGIDSLQTDQFFFDNYLLRREPKSCRCPRCMSAFHEYLQKKYPTEAAVRERFGFPSLNWIRLSEWDTFNRPEDLQTLDDPVLQEWTRFRCEALADQCREFYDYIKGRNPNISVGFNLKGVYSFNRIWQNAVYHPLFSGHCDFFCFDIPGVVPGIDPQTGALVTEIRSYKTGRTLDIACSDGDPGVSLAEQMAFNYTKKVSGFGWHGMGYNHYVERIFTPQAEFFREYCERYYTDTRSVADCAVLRSWPSMAYNMTGPWISSTLAEQTLIQHRVPFDILYDEEIDSLGRYQEVILGDQESLSQSNVDKLLAFARGGGTLLFTGNTADYNQWRQKRPVNPLIKALGGARPTAVTVHGYGKGKLVYFPEITPGMTITPRDVWAFPATEWVLPANHENLYHALVENLPRGLSASAEAPLTTAMEVTHRPESRETILHFVNYDTAHSLAPFRVRLNMPPGKVRSVQFFSPEHDGPLEVKFKPEGAGIAFTVPGMGLYGMIVAAEK